MCDRCIEIDLKIVRYRGITKAAADKRVVEAAEALIAELEAEKLALHPNPEK